MNATATDSAATATGVATAAATGGSGTAGGNGGQVVQADGNLEKLSAVTLQLGNLVVISGQKAFQA